MKLRGAPLMLLVDSGTARRRRVRRKRPSQRGVDDSDAEEIKTGVTEEIVG